MSHNRTEYKFETEAEAQTFFDQYKNATAPSSEIYVQGPFFMDAEIIYKSIPWNESKEKWWQVNIEYFCG